MNTRFFFVYFLSFVCVLLLSCAKDVKDNTDNNFYEAREAISTPISHIKLPLSNVSTFYSNGVQLVKGKSGRDSLLILLYTKAQKLLVYDLTTKTQGYEIPLYAEGPNSVGGEVSGFFWKDENNIFVSSYWEESTFKINKKGLISGKYDIPEKIGEHYYTAASYKAPLQVLDGAIYAPSVINLDNPPPNPRQSSHPVIKYESEQNISFLGKYDTRFFDKNWATKNDISFDYNPQKDAFIISIGMSDSLQLVRSNGTILKQVSAPSKFIQEIIPYANTWGVVPKLSKEKSWQHDLNPKYEAIKYDPYRNIYYRFVQLGMSVQDFMDKKTMPTSLMVLDENLNVKQEVQLPNYAHPFMVFVGKDGLHIANKYSYDSVDDNFIQFDIYAFK